MAIILFTAFFMLNNVMAVIVAQYADAAKHERDQAARNVFRGVTRKLSVFNVLQTIESSDAQGGANGADVPRSQRQRELVHDGCETVIIACEKISAEYTPMDVTSNGLKGRKSDCSRLCRPHLHHEPCSKPCPHPVLVY